MVETKKEVEGIRSFFVQGTQIFLLSSLTTVRIFYFSRRSSETTFKHERAD